VRLTLAEALRMGLGANHRVQAARYETPIAQSGWVEADAAFDTLLTARFEASTVEEPSPSTAFGPALQSTSGVGVEAEVSRALRSGGSVSLLYQADRIRSNNPFWTVNPYWTPGLSAEVVHPLLRGAGDVALTDLRRAQNGVVLAQSLYQTTIEEVLLEIVVAYWELAFADANLEARTTSERVARELLADEQARLEAQVNTPLDVAEARAGFERRRSERFGAENLRASSQDRLVALILPFSPTPAARIVIDAVDAALPLPTDLPGEAQEAALVALALRGRPELRAGTADIANRGLDTYEAYDSIRPQLDVLGRVSTTALDGDIGGAHEGLYEGQAVAGTIGIEFSMFIGQRAARARWRAAAWARRQAVIRQRELENQVVVDVRKALRDVATSQAQIVATEAAVSASSENLEGERQRLESGKSTPFRVLEKEEEWTENRQRLAREQANLREAVARLWRAVGVLAERTGSAIPRWPPCANASHCGPGSGPAEPTNR
jgi:outer membrane protein TolC